MVKLECIQDMYLPEESTLRLLIIITYSIT